MRHAGAARLHCAAQKKDDPRRNHPLVLFELLAEVALQQAFESLAVAGFVASHFIKTCAKAWFCVQLSTTYLQL